LAIEAHMHPATVPVLDKATSDAELAKRIGAGDQDAFRLLMRRHNQRMYRAARSILKDDAEAEDVVQEAYLLAYRAMDKFRGDARLSTWLVRIVVNEAIARERKRSRSAEVIRLDGWTEPQFQATEVSMNESSPEQPDESAVRAEARRLLEARIDELPHDFRMVFVLRAVEEMSVEEAASCLGIPEATVRTRYFRAKGLLREALSRDIDFALEDAFSFAGERCDRIVAGVLARLEDAPASDG
jgi:RNA polymerase sigma-70 factor (ECF subfamily)